MRHADTFARLEDFLSRSVIFLVWAAIVLVNPSLIACERHQSEKSSFYAEAGGGSLRKITVLCADSEGRLFAGTSDSGVFQREPDNSDETGGTAATQGAGQVKGAVETPQDQGSWKRIDKKSGISFDAVHSVAIDENANLWVGTASGLNRVSRGSILKIFAEKGFEDNTVTSLGPEGDILYIGTNRGFFTADLASSVNRTWTEDDRLPSNLVTSVCVVGSGRAIVGTSSGLAVFDNGRIMAPEGLKGKWVTSVIRSDRVTGSMKHIRKRLEKDPPTAGRPSDKAGLLARNAEILMKTVLDGLRTRKSESESDVTVDTIKLIEKLLRGNKAGESSISTGRDGVDDGPPPGAVSFFFGCHDGCYEGWLTGGGDNGVMWRRIDTAWVKCLALDGAGTLWIGSRNMEIRCPGNIDIYTQKNINLQKVVDDASLREGKPLSMAMDGTGDVVSLIFSDDGFMWVGVDGLGVFRLRNVNFNYDAVLHAKTAEREDPMTITTPQPEIPPDIMSLFTGYTSMAKEVLPDHEVWVGRLSELNDEDMKSVAGLLGRSGIPTCIRNLCKVAYEDPYVLVPWGPVESTPESAGEDPDE